MVGMRLVPAIVLFFLAPVCGEYLIGYDEYVGRPLALLGGLLIFGPLYGAPALLIREATRRTGRGWPTMLLLAAACGLFQAGIVDQSLFNTSYRDLDQWSEYVNPTLLPGLGTSAYLLTNFVAGHMIWTFGTPIAVVETLAADRARTPWLRWPGLTLMVILYALACWLVFRDHLDTQGFVAAPAQLIGTAVAVVLLVVAAFAVRPSAAPLPAAAVPPPWLVGVLSVVAFLAYTMLPTSWPGVATSLVILAGVAVAVTRLSRRAGWGRAHVLAVAAGPLLAYALLGFTVTPIGDPPAALKYGHNVAMLVFAVALLALSIRAVRRQPLEPSTMASHE